MNETPTLNDVLSRSETPDGSPQTLPRSGSVAFPHPIQSDACTHIDARKDQTYRSRSSIF